MPGLRTDAGPGWRSDAAAIAGTTRLHPHLLVIGMIGFMLRGGILLLTVPILILPTSVEVRLLLGGNLNSTGLTPGFFLIVTGLSIGTLLVALLVLYTLARCELASFSRFVNAPQSSDNHAWSAPGQLTQRQRTAVTSKLFVIEALALLAVLIAAIPLASALGSATLSEIVSPSSTASIYSRIFNDVSPQLIGFVAAIVAVEAVSAVATRHLLARTLGLRAFARIEHHALRTLAVAVLGWALLIGALLVTAPALGLAWEAVRSVYLSTGSSGGIRDLASALLVALLFGGVFAATLFVGGLISTIRSGMWTLASLR